jgi:hypothetical protein
MFSCKDTAEELPDLTGTSWKLAGIVNVETGELRELEPKACAECFTLTFYSGHEASGRSITRNARIDLLNLDPGRVRVYIYYDEGGYPDGDTFRTALFRTESFALTPDELKLFYHNSYNQREYLLFKRLQP